MENLNNEVQQLNIEGISLIGQFNNKNEYILPLKIKQQFISVPKIITHIENNVIYCYFKSISSTYNFIVEIDDKNKDDIVCAKLFLVEFYRNFDNENRSIISFLTKYTGYSAENFVERVKVVLKLHEKDDSDGKDFNEEVLADKCKLQKKKVYHAYFNDIALNNKSMVQESIKLLKDYGPIGEDILQNLIAILNDMNLIENSAEYWICARKELRKLLKKNKNKLDIKTLNELQLVYQNFLLLNKKTFKQFQSAEEIRMKSFEDSSLMVPLGRKEPQSKHKDDKKEKMLYSDLIGRLDENHNGLLDYKEYLQEPNSLENDDNFILSEFLDGIVGGFMLIEILHETVQNIVDFGKELMDLPN